MKIYFLSATPCALTVNEAYFGKTDLFERCATLSLKDNLFIRFTPENAAPISFFLTENIRFSPPDGCEVYLLNEAIAIYAYDFPPRDLTLFPITQKREGNTLVTVFKQGRIQVSVQTQENFFVSYLPPCFEECSIDFHGNFILLRASSHLAVFHKNGTRLLSEKILSCSLEETGISALLPLSDLLERVADCTWEYQEDTLKQTSFSLKQARDSEGGENQEKIRNELLPYALFEGLLLGAEITHLLSESLQSKAGELKGFLGEYVSVALTREAQTCALLRKKGERLFEAAYFSVEIENGKIVDIHEK